MGGLVSSENKESDKLIGSGTYGKVYLTENTQVRKLMKYDEVTKDYDNEISFFKWINTLPRNEQVFFSVLYSNSKYKDTSFKHYPRNSMNDDEFQQRVDRRNNLQFTCEIICEYKGERISMNHSTPLLERRKLLVQLLTIVKIMQKHAVMHLDIHSGNLVCRDGQLALIDYGISETVPSEKHIKNNEMVIQVASWMINFDDTLKRGYDKIRKDSSYTIPQEEDILECCYLHNASLYAYISMFCAEHGYPLGNTKNEWKHNYVAFSVADILLKVVDFKLYCKVYQIDTFEQPWFPREDLMTIFNNWRNIDNSIEYFNNLIT